MDDVSSIWGVMENLLSRTHLNIFANEKTSLIIYTIYEFIGVDGKNNTRC
jgi:hypothetical protein